MQRREEIREMIDDPDKYTKDPDLRGALIELLAHIDTLEQRAAERVIADGSREPTPDYTGEGGAWVPPVGARAVVVPNLTKSTVEAIAEAETRVGSDGPFASREQAALAEVGSYIRRLRAIPADRVLGEGMMAVDREELEALRRFAERCAQRDHQPDEHIGSAKCVACEAEDALRASQGGAAT